MRNRKEATMNWMDFNRDGEVDGFETYVGL